MCPVISLKFEDLTPRQFYTVMIDFVLMDEFRYSFDAGTNTWLPYCREMPVEEGRAKVFVHAETPWNGATLMTNGLTFKTLKLTNSPKTAEKSSQVRVFSNAFRLERKWDLKIKTKGKLSKVGKSWAIRPWLGLILDLFVWKSGTSLELIRYKSKSKLKFMTAFGTEGHQVTRVSRAWFQ